ncbi:MAG TPA: MBL fold metallo-hydrolase [Thermomicrobiaceae bacterium]|nr:MBL fold metallo-hydrolase [Thermomicrobiaceae bacterium]
MEPTITWYAQSAIRIDAEGIRIYVDPYHLPDDQPPADVLIITHQHGDHLSPDDIAKVRHEETAVFANPTAAEKLSGRVFILRPGQIVHYGPLEIRAVPAYTITKLRKDGEPTHPKAEEHIGVVLDIGDHTFYDAADTDVIPEMESIGPVDYAFLPVSGRAVMTAEEAAEAARIVQPTIAVPVHFGGPMGTIDDARRFAELVPSQVRVWIMEPAGNP